MWWEPQDEHELLVLEDVELLSSWFQERHMEKSAPAWGVGSVWVTDEEALFPFVLLNAALIEGAWMGYEKSPWRDGGLPIFRSDDRAIGRERGLGVPETRLPLFVSFAFRPVAAETRLKQALQFIEDQIAVRDYVVCRNTGACGTAAVQVRDRQDGKIGLLTAGHTFPDGVGSLVERLKWRHLRRLSPHSRFGRISHHVMPRPGRADWDVAVIRCRNGLDQRSQTLTHCRSRLRRDESVFAYGARSGFMSDATIVRAAMRSHGDEFRTWKNCWLMGPSGVLRPGDSGSAIFATADHALFGLYVGSSRTAFGRASFHFVQDAHSIGQQVLSSWGYEYC
ncbi:MAG: hypothetical protein QOJ94_2905 [Sphingomonadales bacterium]|jgi:hypothetical protein|nr:hypothetical protein [Sphingomonadales bacterium]